MQLLLQSTSTPSSSTYVRTSYICTYIVHRTYVHTSYIIHHTSYIVHRTSYIVHKYVHRTYVRTWYICIYFLHLYVLRTYVLTLNSCTYFICICMCLCTLQLLVYCAVQCLHSYECSSYRKHCPCSGNRSFVYPKAPSPPAKREMKEISTLEMDTRWYHWTYGCASSLKIAAA